MANVIQQLPETGFLRLPQIIGKRELIDAGLIVETRKGARPNKASLYAVTWCALDQCGNKLDISPSAFPRGAYRLHDPVPKIPVKNGGVTSPRAVVDSR